MWNQLDEEMSTEWMSEARLKTCDEIGWDPRVTAYLGGEYQNHWIRGKSKAASGWRRKAEKNWVEV